MICPNCRGNINPNNGRCPNCNFPLPGLDSQANITFNNVGNLTNMTELEEFNNQFSLNNNSLDQSIIDKPEEVKDKKHKKSPLLLIVFMLLVVLLIALSLYIVYDKLYNKNSNVIEKNTTTKQYVLSKQEALGLGNYLWNYTLDTVWCRNFTYSDNTSLISDGVEGYEITNYDDVVKYFTADFTYEYNDNQLTFNDIFGNHILDNKYYDANKCVRDVNPSYKDTVLDIKLIDKNSIVYKATSTYCEGENCIDKNIEKEFEIVKEKKLWKIKKFYLPN